MTRCHVQILLLLGPCKHVCIFFKKMQYVESISVFILKGIMSFLQKMRENTQKIAVLSSKRNVVGRFLLIFSMCVSGYIARSTMIHCCNFENDCQDHYSSIKLTHFESASTLSSFFKTNNTQVTYNTTGRKQWDSWAVDSRLAGFQSRAV